MQDNSSLAGPETVAVLRGRDVFLCTASLRPSDLISNHMCTTCWAKQLLTPLCVTSYAALQQ